MTTATDYINAARAELSGEVDQNALTTMLGNSDITPDQDWDNGTTTWDFEDGSAIRTESNETHVFGEMPNTNIEDWYLVAS